MTKKEFEALRKKTIKICVFTILIGALACIVPVIILRGMINYSSKLNSNIPGAYLAAGIISAAIIVVIALVCVRTIVGTMRKYRDGKNNCSD